MRFQTLLFILLISVTMAACGSCAGTQEEPGGASNDELPVNTNPNANTGNSVSEANENPLEANIDTVAKPEQTVEAVTLKPVVEAYCAAMRNKDEAALRKVYSQAAVRRMTAKMQAEGGTSLVEYLSLEAPGNKCQVVNETVQGASATAYVITEAYPEGTAFRFVKENDGWKMTDESPDVDRVKQN